MFGCCAVLQAMWSACILGDVATDRRCCTARWVRREVKSELLDVAREMAIDNTALDDRPTLFFIHLDDMIEPRCDDQHTIFQGECSATKPGAGASCHIGQILLLACAHDLRDLLSSLRKQ